MRLVNANSGTVRVTASDRGVLRFNVRVSDRISEAFVLLQGFELKTESGDRQLNRVKVAAEAVEYNFNGPDTFVAVKVKVQMPDDGGALIDLGPRTILAKVWVVLVIPDAGES